MIRGHRVGEPERDCKVLEVKGEDGGPPYLVQWEDSEHESLFFPGSDATVVHVGKKPRPRAKAKGTSR